MTQRESLHLDPESQRLVKIVYDEFVHAGAALSEADKEKLKKLNEEASKLEDEFSRGLLQATKNAAYTTTDRSALAGLSDAQIAAAAQAAAGRKGGGVRDPPAKHDSAAGPDRTDEPRHAPCALREELDPRRAARRRSAASGGAPGATACARRRSCSGFPNYAAWVLQDQMAKTPAAVLHFLNELIPPATAKAKGRGTGDPGAHRPAAGRVHAASRGTGISTPSRCARRSTIWTSRS